MSTLMDRRDLLKLGVALPLATTEWAPTEPDIVVVRLACDCGRFYRFAIPFRLDQPLMIPHVQCPVDLRVLDMRPLAEAWMAKVREGKGNETTSSPLSP